MLTIDPPPAAVIGSITAFMPSQQPTTLTSRTCRKSASGMSAIGANFSTPALFTSTSSRPKASSVAATAAAQSRLAGHVVVHVAAGRFGAEPGGDRRAPVVEHVAEHHPRALGDEVPHVRLAHAPGAAGDQRDLAVEPAHGPSRSAEPNACLVREGNSLGPGRRQRRWRRPQSAVIPSNSSRRNPSTTWSVL